MTDQQKLEALINLAIENSWFDITGFNGYTVWSPVSLLEPLIIFEDKVTHEKRQYNYEAILFNREFAYCIWGQDNIHVKDVKPWDEWNASESLGTAWKYHIKQMAVSEDRIDYAYQSVFGDKG